MEYRYCFTGYRGYALYCERIQRILNYVIKDPDMRFFFAVNEAVCNAARYGKKGIEKTKIMINIIVNSQKVEASVVSSSEFEAKKVYRSLKELARQYPDRHWGEATRQQISGRGFWIMMDGADRVRIHLDKKVAVHLSKNLNLEFNANDDHCLATLVQRLSIGDEHV